LSPPRRALAYFAAPPSALQEQGRASAFLNSRGRGFRRSGHLADPRMAAWQMRQPGARRTVASRGALLLPNLSTAPGPYRWPRLFHRSRRGLRLALGRRRCDHELPRWGGHSPTWLASPIPAFSGPPHRLRLGAAPFPSHRARPSLCPTPSRAFTEPLHFLDRGCVAPDRRGCAHGFLRWGGRTS
jgi:hypothetical protein